MKFEAKISKMGRRRIINVPNKNKDFQSGDKVEVIKKTTVKTNKSKNNDPAWAKEDLSNSIEGVE